MSPLHARQRSGKPRVSTPWGRKRKRAFISFVVLVLLLSPALVWRLRLSGEVRQLVTTQREQGRLLTIEEGHGGPEAFLAEENGAGDIQEAVSGFQPFSQQHLERLPFLSGQQPPAADGFSEEQWEAMEGLVSANVDVVKRLLVAAEKPSIHYPEDYLARSDVGPTDHVATLNALVVLLCCDALLAAESRDTASAWRSLHAALVVIRSLGSDESLDSLYRQWTLETQLLYTLQWVLGKSAPEGDALNAFEAWFTPERRTAQWQRACDVELSVFIARMGRSENRGLFRGLLLAAGVGDLNLKAAFALHEPMRSGFGLRPAEQLPHEKAYRQVHTDIQAHGLLYATVQRRHRPAHWDVMRQAWAEIVLAEVALAVEAYRVEHGDYPAKAWVEEKASNGALSQLGELHYKAGSGSCELEIRSGDSTILSRWAVGPGAWPE